MTVAELIEWLKTQDQGAVVQVVVAFREGRYSETIFSDVDFDPSASAYTDLRPLNVNKRTLLLGEMP